MSAAFYKFADDGAAKHREQDLEVSNFLPGGRVTREKALDVMVPPGMLSLMQ